MSGWRSLAFLVCLLGAVSPAFGRTFYVNPTANGCTCGASPCNCSDANPGDTPATAWRTPPGTRTVSDSGPLNPQWGTVAPITPLNRVQCGDTILLKGGSTHTSAVGGAWRIDCNSGGFYVCGCTQLNPITIKVATNAQWTGSTGHFTIDCAGMSSTNANVLQRRGMFAVIDVDGLKFGGVSTTQRLRITGEPTSHADFVGHFMFTGFAVGGKVQFIDGQWLESANFANADFGDAGLLITDMEDSVIADMEIADTPKLGVYSGPFKNGPVKSTGLVRVNVRRSGPPAPTNNDPQDAMQLGCAKWDNTKGGGGGLWTVDCTIADNIWNGYIGGGNNTCNNPGGELIRVLGGEIIGNGRANNSFSSKTGFEHGHGGPGVPCTAFGVNWEDEPEYIFINTVWYGNRTCGSNGSHGGGNQSYWNNIFLNDAGAAAGATACGPRWARDGCQEELKNSIILEPGQARSHSFSNSGFEQVITDNPPDQNYNLWIPMSGSGASTVSSFTLNPTFSATARSYNNYALAGYFGANEIVYTDSAPKTTGFAGTGGNCLVTGFHDGTAESFYRDCDLHNTGTGSGVNAGTFYLKTSNSGTTTTVVGVQANGQVTNHDSHAADPRKYFREPDSYLHAGTCSNAMSTLCSVDAECTGGGQCIGEQVQVAGMTCAAGTPSATAGIAYIRDMTATTITLDRACTWTANQGVHRPWRGTAPDMGAFEFQDDGVGGATTTTSSSTSSSTSTSVSTSSSTSSSSSTTSTTIFTSTTIAGGGGARETLTGGTLFGGRF